MKKSVLLGATTFILAIFWIFQFCWAAEATEIESYLKVGTINVRDGAINEGHKSHVAVGFNLSTDPTKKFQGLFTAEGWVMGEPSDEDGEIPDKGIGLLFEGRRNFFLFQKSLKIFPYVSAGLHQWERDGSEKTVERWHSVSFLEGKAGLGAEYKFFYAKAAVRRPLWIDDSGLDPGFGFESEAGIKIKKLRIGLFYDRFGFNSSGSFNINFWGGKVGFSF